MSVFTKHPTALVEEGATIGNNTRIWAFCNIQSGAKVGADCNICDGAFIESGAQIGDQVTIKHHVSIFNGVTIGNNVFIGSNIAFINDRFPRSLPGREWNCEKTEIKDGATVGSNATIICGVTVQKYAMIGAGSVVTKDVESHVMVSGNPAKPIGYVCSCGKKLDEQYQCVCGQQYQLTDQGLALNE